MNTTVSVIIPNHNGSAFAETCLKALFDAEARPFEVIVVDDCSTDNSADIISRYPCSLIRLEKHGGASKARNTGAKNSRGSMLLFIDMDCVVQKDTVLHAVNAYEKNRDCVTGGSYTPIAYDDTFFSTFQSIFINYSEFRNPEPDYIASHAMVIGRDLFEKSSGFPEDFGPIIEDVEFSHRLRRAGVRLITDRSILVQHIFNYDLMKSLKNAFRKSKYWTAYSIGNRDLTADSGTASLQLKLTVACSCLAWLLFVCFVLTSRSLFLAGMVIIFVISLAAGGSLIRAFFREKGLIFGVTAALYYSLVYPLAVAAGGLAGIYYYSQSRAGAA